MRGAFAKDASFNIFATNDEEEMATCDLCIAKCANQNAENIQKLIKENL